MNGSGKLEAIADVLRLATMLWMGAAMYGAVAWSLRHAVGGNEGYVSPSVTLRLDWITLPPMLSGLFMQE